MPANLSPQYLKAEQAYRQAQTAEEKLRCLREMFALLPKHKGTEKLQADLKQRISRTKEELDQERKRGRRGASFRIRREGAGQVVIIGPPNAGKSQLLASLTNAEPTVAVYPYTTHAPQPGMMPWQDVQIQLVDTPPITADYLEGYLTGMLRAADAALVLVDLSTDEGPEQTQEVVDRLAQSKTYLVGKLPEDDDQFGANFCKALMVAAKLDSPGAAERLEVVGELFGQQFEVLAVSAVAGLGMEELADRIWHFLGLIRVYTKEPGQKSDLNRPYTCPRGSTVLDVAGLVHKDIADNLKFARLWGAGVHDGQAVARDHVLHDRDVLELHI